MQIKARIESEKKKKQFIEACENLDPLKLIPEKILQSQHLIDTLKLDEIDMSMLYQCGCPDEWLSEAHRSCSSKRKKPKYSNECANCWLENLTDEIEIEQTEERSIPEIIKRCVEYEKLGLEPEQLDEILTYLGWNTIQDYRLFLDTVQDMSDFYKTKE